MGRGAFYWYVDRQNVLPYAEKNRAYQCVHGIESGAVVLVNSLECDKSEVTSLGWSNIAYLLLQISLRN